MASNRHGRPAYEHPLAKRRAMRPDHNQRGPTLLGDPIDLKPGQAGSNDRVRLESLLLQQWLLSRQMRLGVLRQPILHHIEVFDAQGVR